MAVTNMHSFITRIFYLYLGVHLWFDDENNVVVIMLLILKNIASFTLHY